MQRTSIQRSFVSIVALSSLTVVARAQAVLHTIEGDSATDQAGRAVALLPDVDGDGVEDFVVGAPFDDPEGFGVRPGTVKLFSGKTGAVLLALVGEGFDSEFGHALAYVPDVDGDGQVDLLIGAPSRSYSVNQQGAAYVYSSATGNKVRAYFGSGASEFLGTSVANLGDTNLDGIDDYAIGAPFADLGGYTDNGRVKVYSGADGAMLDEFWQGLDFGHFGWAIGRAGDVNGDGRSDYLIGAPGESSWGYNYNGAAYLFTGGSWASHLYRGTEDFQQYGWSFATLGDITGEGYDDFAIGTPFWDGNGVSRGRVRVYSYAPNVMQFEIEGYDGWRLGESMAGIGDFNGDGTRDLAIGVTGYALLGSSELGAVRIYSGASGALLKTLLGADADGMYGQALDGGRDLNGDGRPELLVGAPGENSHGSNAGTARLVLGEVRIPTPYGTPKVNSLGCTPTIGFSGAPSRTLGDNFHITADDVRSSTNGMLFWGFTQQSTPFHGGWLLVGQPIVRSSIQNAGFFGIGPNCTGWFDFHFSQALMQQWNLQPGVQIYAQYWSRDPGFSFPDNMGLTNALSFEIAK
jgi:hypothetical protein